MNFKPPRGTATFWRATVQAPDHPPGALAAIAERARSDEPERTGVREDAERGREPK
jgi:hypothetical protein